MRRIKIKMLRLLSLFFLSVLLSNCVEPFEPKLEDFENFLVVNSTVTNQVKHHQVFLSRTFKFEENVFVKEKGATVKVIEDGVKEYIFEEVSEGVYQSVEEFGCLPNKEYQLSITTINGNTYESEKETLPDNVPIQEVYPKSILDDDNEDAIGVFVNTIVPKEKSKYYRYEFEETYRYTARFWVPDDIEIKDTVVLPSTNFGLELETRSDDFISCYITNSSNTTLINNASSLQEGAIASFLVKLIEIDDIRIEDRYSILVKQFAQTKEAHTFYEQLKIFSESENLFSQVQPGFITGNIIPNGDNDDPVIGYFEVSTVSEKRIFFDRKDVAKAGAPKYRESCEIIVLKQNTEEFETFDNFLERLRATVRGNSLVFHSWKIEDAIVNFVRRPCGDCTAKGERFPPDYWED
ncbi:DUF4249 domain-containing protein [Aquimarina sp. 2201CG1-2-11]|uniref:DUF4249 domain-containing protein n=1 Tax=Aquimarina discodermiae TaxID=3231043 RepID=UPI0034636800